MGTVKNVGMNYFNEADYDVIRPNILLGNASDWTNSIYSKEEIDAFINSIEQKQESFQNFVVGGYIGGSNSYEGSFYPIVLGFRPMAVFFMSSSYLYDSSYSGDTSRLVRLMINDTQYFTIQDNGFSVRNSNNGDNHNRYTYYYKDQIYKFIAFKA